MFDEYAFYDLARRKGKTLKEIAAAIGITTPTLHRKISGQSDFYRGEIQKICELMGEENLNYIFFAPEVSYA